MADGGIWTHFFWLANHGDAQAVVLIKVLTALQWSLRVLGNFRKKEEKRTLLNWIFSSRKKFFDEK